jgi:regulator of sirC expression with transglutaminase-like and TPR domain
MASPPAASGEAARSQFRELAAGPDSDIDLATGALLIAAEDAAPVDVEGALTQLELFADEARPKLEGAGSDHDLVARLNRSLFEEHGFRGNADDYHDLRNSFLHSVLERRLGIPITLCIVYVDVARRLGLDAHGVGFPGHFLAKVVSGVDGCEILVDPFHQRIVTRSDCERQLRNSFGARATLEPELLAATGPRRILARMLANLKQIYLERRDLEAAIACSDRILLLEPTAALELRDRGMMYQALECFGAAADDLERFLALAPAHESATSVRETLGTLRRRTAQIH